MVRVGQGHRRPLAEQFDSESIEHRLFRIDHSDMEPPVPEDADDEGGELARAKKELEKVHAPQPPPGPHTAGARVHAIRWCVRGGPNRGGPNDAQDPE